MNVLKVLAIVVLPCWSDVPVRTLDPGSRGDNGFRALNQRPVAPPTGCRRARPWSRRTSSAVPAGCRRATRARGCGWSARRRRSAAGREPAGPTSAAEHGGRGSPRRRRRAGRGTPGRRPRRAAGLGGPGAPRRWPRTTRTPARPRSRALPAMTSAAAAVGLDQDHRRRRPGWPPRGRRRRSRRTGRGPARPQDGIAGLERGEQRLADPVARGPGARPGGRAQRAAAGRAGDDPRHQPCSR